MVVRKKGLSVGISSEWVKKDGDCSPCLNCKEPIFGPRYNLEITVAMQRSEAESNLCEPCYLQMEDNGSQR